MIASIVLSVELAIVAAYSAPAQILNESLLSGLTYRNLGPYNTGAWTGAWTIGVAIPEAPAKAHRTVIMPLCAAAASGNRPMAE